MNPRSLLSVRPLAVTTAAVAVLAAGPAWSAGRDAAVPDTASTTTAAAAVTAATASSTQRVSIIVDNHVLTRDTSAPNVRDALMEAGVSLDHDDRLSHPRTRAVTSGLVVRVVRVRTVRTVTTVRTPFSTTRKADATLAKGTSRTVRAGAVGTTRRTIASRYADARLEKRSVVSSAVVKAPVSRVVAVGTGTAPPRASRSRGTGAEGLDWAALARCESGGNPRAVSASGRYRGLYQFAIATWRGVGGTGDPIDNSAAEQTYRAQVLYSRSGRGPWPVCGRYL